jgi:hypothetical protein
MRLDLERLKEAHPLLPASTAAEYAHRAAVALELRHAPGVIATVRLGVEEHVATLHWNDRPTADALMLDRHRATEDGAEAVALSLVHASQGWVLQRRLQRGEHADWLLRDRRGGLVALEVSGTDDGDEAARLREKVAQVALCELGSLRAACVVRFLEPRAALVLVSEVAR